MIVKKNSAGRWLDDNQGDWTDFISGDNAAWSGRLPGWDMPDHDLAVINAATFSVQYASGLMNLCMALGVNPATGQITVVGTDAINQIRFQPVLDGIFVRVEIALVDFLTLTNQVLDLNPHLNYQTPVVPESLRELSLGDPRAIVWSSDGTRGYITGMGSGNLITIDAQGERVSTNAPIELGEGPTGLALDEGRGRLYVYNRFDGSISTVDVTNQVVIATLPLLDPTPAVIKAGRPFLYRYAVDLRPGPSGVRVLSRGCPHGWPGMGFGRSYFNRRSHRFQLQLCQSAAGGDKQLSSHERPNDDADVAGHYRARAFSLAGRPSGAGGI